MTTTTNENIKLATVRVNGTIRKNGIFLNASDAANRAKELADKFGKENVTCKMEILPFTKIRMCDIGGKDCFVTPENFIPNVNQHKLLTVVTISMNGQEFKVNDRF